MSLQAGISKALELTSSDKPVTGNDSINQRNAALLALYDYVAVESQTSVGDGVQPNERGVRYQSDIMPSSYRSN